MSVLLLIFRSSLSEERSIWLITNRASPSTPALDLEVNPAGVFSLLATVCRFCAVRVCVSCSSWLLSMYTYVWICTHVFSLHFLCLSVPRYMEHKPPRPERRARFVKNCLHSPFCSVSLKLCFGLMYGMMLYMWLMFRVRDVL
jgi:hypothetical protein